MMTHPQATDSPTTSTVSADEARIQLDLTGDERFILRAGLLLWRHDAEPPEALLIAMGFHDRTDFSLSRDRIGRKVRASEPLPLSDWRRALAATEFCFVSDCWGSSTPWRYETSYSDEMTIDLLRSIQRRLAAARS